MESLVKSITGINHLFDFQKASVSQRMSWAARRETTRLEDKVYYLMELFGVNMPLLYGEGEKASIRLQLEILQTSDDESIFAWNDESGRAGVGYLQLHLVRSETPGLFRDIFGILNDRHTR
jgi:hypothetical protein